MTLQETLARQRGFFRAGETRSLSFRREQLEKLSGLLREHEVAVTEALRADLGKPRFEAYVSEIALCVSEVNHALEHLESWTTEERVRTSLALFPATSGIVREPLGLVLIIAPWNYPFQLTIAPWISALAAGNCAVLKPSEQAPATADLLATLVGDHFDEQLVTVVKGGPEEAEALLHEKFDHIFYTGGAEVGRRVMRAAAERLTPVTLELGGKTPCIVDEDVSVGLAARRIAWGKFLNAGQTCIAPDYLLVPESRVEALVAGIENNVRRFFGADPRTSPDYARIVNRKHFERLIGYLKDGRIVLGGETEGEERYLAPTLLADVAEDAPVLGEEIFGPILPVVPYRSLDEAVVFARSRPDPLALYVFSNRSETVERVLKEIPSGSAAVNDVLVQFSSTALPFGGRGTSGMGRYHGRFGFETFSHARAVIHGARLFDPPLRYPPYRGKLWWIKKILG